jgi:HEAT repeat protein
MAAAAQIQATDGAITPGELVSAFSTGSFRIGIGALQKLKQAPDKGPFLQPALKFLDEEQEDGVRCWAASALAVIGGKRAFEALLSVFDSQTPDQEKRYYRYTRFFALRGLELVATTGDEKAKLDKLLNELWRDRWQDAVEDYLVQAEAIVLLARRGAPHALAQIRAMIRLAREDFWIAWALFRALQEFPVREAVDELVDLMRKGFYLEHRARAIRALGSYTGNESVVSELSLILRTSPDPYLRLTAVQAIGRLGNSAGKDALLQALLDEDAEIRVQATIALTSLLPQTDAVSLIIQRALSEDTPKELWGHLYDALRRIDSERIISVEILNKELGGEDRRRAEAAEEILLNLGGWAAMHRLTQRRTTLQTLDNILSESEQVVRATFKDTIRQAHRNFYFAMFVNVLVVGIGIALIVIAIKQLAHDPTKLESWVLPGGAGVLGIVINGWFNNPRQHAREDLTTLLDVNVIFLGYLRQLNQIDATFKHAYIENFEFGLDDMKSTVQQIDRTLDRTLAMTAAHLGTTLRVPHGRRAADEKQVAPETDIAGQAVTT